MDNVNHPRHYTAGGIEVIDFLKAKLTQKALWYLNRLCKDCTMEYHSMQIPEGDDEK